MTRGQKSGPIFWKKKEVRSGLEERVRKDLDRRKVPYEYESLKIPYYKLVCNNCGHPVKKGNYIPDFIIGSVIVEAKGRFTAIDRAKHLAVHKLNPEIDLRILFQRNQKISKISKTHYTDWCETHNIQYAIGEKVPEEWVKDGLSEEKASLDRLEILQQFKRETKK